MSNPSHDNDLDVITTTQPLADIFTQTPANTPSTEPQPSLDAQGFEEPIDLSLGGQEVLSTSVISQSQEQTRAKIAMLFTQVFLTLVIVSFIMPLALHLGRPDLLPNPIETTKDLATTVASILAGPFGFVVGFYFKKDLD